MDRIDLALRRYEQIVPKPVDHSTLPLRKLKVWLKEDVVTVLEDFSRRPAFREHAAWPVRVLRNGAQTPERELIDGIDTGLVSCAQALRKLCSHRLVQKKIEERKSEAFILTSETVLIGGTKSRTIAAERAPSFASTIEQNQVQAIAERDWTDLVDINDYFGPVHEWTDKDDGTKTQFAEGVVSLNPELLPIGNFVVRRLLARIRLRVDVLQSLRRKCLKALQQVQPDYRKVRDDLDSAWLELSRLNNELERVLFSGSVNRLRDACIAATQIYGAFHPDPDLSWLGLNITAANNGLRSIKLRATGWDNDHLFERIAGALGSFRQMYPAANPGRSAFDEAVAGGGLVIDTVRCMAYWEATQLENKPTGVQWKLLVALARKTPSGSAVEIRDVWESGEVLDSAMSTTWGRLKPRLPASLRHLVVPGTDRSTYRLELDAGRVHIFP